jgi:heme exporter protein C
VVRVGGTSSRADRAFEVFLVCTALAIVGTIHFVAYQVPVEATMGVV